MSTVMSLGSKPCCSQHVRRRVHSVWAYRGCGTSSNLINQYQGLRAGFVEPAAMASIWR